MSIPKVNKNFPSYYWNSIQNRKDFLDKAAILLNIKKPEDWGEVRVRNIYELGGGAFLEKYYKKSLFICLKSIYEDIEWKKEWFSKLKRVPKSHWNSIENRKQVMDKIAKQLNIKNPQDWGKITTKQVCELGGRTILFRFYKGSVFNCLKSIYTDIEWKREWFSGISQFPQSYWLSMENRKKFLDQIASELNIINPSDWGKVDVKYINEKGGASLLNNYYDHSLIKCLRSVYTDIDWKKEWFFKSRITSDVYWKSIENRKKFLDKIATELLIHQPSDWGKVTVSQIQDVGGGTLIEYYKGSIFSCLRSVYKDVEWKREWFSGSFRFSKEWLSSLENSRKFLEKLALRLDIKEPHEWGSIHLKTLYDHGIGTLLKYHKGSLFHCLNSVFGEIEWKRDWFKNPSRLPNAYWNSFENRKKFLDETAKKLHIKTSSDWGKVTWNQIRELGGSSLLNNHFNGSLFACLQSVYKDRVWKKEWFSNIPRFHRAYWNSTENCKIFLDEIARSSNIHSSNDWRKVTVSVIQKQGGKGLLLKYGGSLQLALKAIYPNNSWNLLLSGSNPSSEMYLQSLLGQVFPNEYLFLHHKKLNK